jgi:hypothetical protein
MNETSVSVRQVINENVRHLLTEIADHLVGCTELCESVEDLRRILDRAIEELRTS